MFTMEQLIEFIQGYCRQTVNFSVNVKTVKCISLTLELKINQGTRCWEGTAYSYDLAKAEAIDKALTDVQHYTDETSLRQFLGMLPRLRNPLVDILRDHIRPIRNLGRNGGYGFGTALAYLYSAVDRIEGALISQGHFIE